MNIRNNSFDFLDYLIKHKLDVFSSSQVAPYFGKMDTKAYVLMENLVKRGWLTKLKKGLYARNPQEEKGSVYIPSWHKVAAGLVYPKEYYIGFYSALQIHDLITQPILKEYVVTSKRVSPKIQFIHGIEFETVYFKSDRFFGYKKTWINDHDKIYCSDLEKTIIDCLYQPQYAGGLEGILKAIDKAKDKIKPNLLIEYAIRFKVQAVLKRLGFILDQLNLYQTEQNILQELITDAYTKLDPSLKIKGTFHRKWRIEDNVDIKDILQTIDT